MKYILLFLIFLTFSTSIYAQDEVDNTEINGITHIFWLRYASVSHGLKNDKGILDTVIKINDLNPKAARFLADYWWKKTLRDCDAKNIIKESRGANFEETKTKFEEELKFCAFEVIYNNWDDINLTIENRYKTIQVNK